MNFKEKGELLNALSEHCSLVNKNSEFFLILTEKACESLSTVDI